MQRLLTFFSKNISLYAIINDQSFNGMLTNNIISFEQLGPDVLLSLTASAIPFTVDCFFQRGAGA